MWMEQWAPTLLGKWRLTCSKLGTRRGAQQEDPFPVVLPGRWEGGTGPWAEQSWLRKQLPAMPQELPHYPRHVAEHSPARSTS